MYSYPTIYNELFGKEDHVIQGIKCERTCMLSTYTVLMCVKAW